MSFVVAAEAYDRFMGRYSSRLAPLFADFGRVSGGKRVIDVGCGPGALTEELVRRVGSSAVTAVDPSAPFVSAIEERLPYVDVRLATAEELPFDDSSFDVALAQLVVQFMRDPVAGLREMARVTRDAGGVVASVWDHGGGHGPLSVLWDVVREIAPGARDESGVVGTHEGELTGLFEQ